MYSILGNIIFDGPFGFSSFENKMAATYARHELINLKPVLQPTGNELDELSIEMHLRAEFVNVAQAIATLKKSLSEFEILPLVKGTGEFVGDFIISEITETHEHALPDGTLVEATLQLTLIEHEAADKLQQQQSTDRKNAFALGNKKPLALNIIQQPTVPQLAADDLSGTNSEADAVDRNVSQYENNVSSRESISGHIQSSLINMDSNLTSLNNRLNDITILGDVSAMVSSINQVKNIINNHFSFPIGDIDDLKVNNRDLQNAMKALNFGSIGLMNLVITRRA